MFEHDVFRRTTKYGDWYVRHDFAWVGLGVAKEVMFDLRGYHVWINHYHRCPLPGFYCLPKRAGWSTLRERKVIQVRWFGSMREPWLHWTFRIGRFYIGADSPQWLVVFKRWQTNRYAQKMYTEMDAFYSRYYPSEALEGHNNKEDTDA